MLNMEITEAEVLDGASARAVKANTCPRIVVADDESARPREV